MSTSWNEIRQRPIRDDLASKFSLVFYSGKSTARANLTLRDLRKKVFAFGSNRALVSFNDSLFPLRCFSD